MLKAEHVALTPLTLADLPILFEWINDRELVLFNAPYKPVSETQHRAWFEDIQQRDDVVIFGIRLLETDKLIGSCQLHNISYVHRSAELQIRLGDAAERGRGYGTEAVRLLLKFGFQDLNLQRIYLHVFSTNAAARSVTLPSLADLGLLSCSSCPRTFGLSASPVWRARCVGCVSVARPGWPSFPLLRLSPSSRVCLATSTV